MPKPKCTTKARRALVGELADGTAIEAITLSNGGGVTAKILSYGATLQSLIVPDRRGVMSDVLLGYDDFMSYVDHPGFFGVTVGRYANRIAGGRFALDGQTYLLPLNDQSNSLHGGGNGFDKKAWRVVSIGQRPMARAVLAYCSPDGEAGYPGTLDVTVSYGLDEGGDLSIEFAATTDRPTIVNMTNHAMFNLSGEGVGDGALQQSLMIPASRFTPVNEQLIPTGVIQPVENTVFDFRSGRTVADHVRDGRDRQIRFGKGYDHNFVLDKGKTETPELAARLWDSVSGRVLEVLSTEPGIQFNTGNYLDGSFVGKKGHVYRMGDGIALEPQKFPDAPNHPNFISARVDPGKPYSHVMVYRMSTMG